MTESGIIRAGILAIGTELTNGQIINRNASWLSNELLKLGFETTHHRVVPDDRQAIIEEIKDLSRKVQLLFVTGGLGPTKDDFTRDCVAEAFDKKLLWNEQAWNWVEERLTRLAQPLRESQKQQCYFPEGSEMMWNDRGTAHGFKFKVTNSGSPNHLQKVFVMPGPPIEVEAVFNAGVAGELKSSYPHIDALIVKSWDCIGLGESEVAHLADSVLDGCPFERGYRVHFPLVEFKLSHRATESSEAAAWISKVDEALASVCVLKDFEEAPNKWASHLPVGAKFQIRDLLTEGEILKRGLFAMGEAGLIKYLHYDSHESSAVAIQFEARLINPGEAEFSLTMMGDKKSLTQKAPDRYLLPDAGQRLQIFFAEQAYLNWMQLLTGSGHAKSQ